MNGLIIERVPVRRRPTQLIPMRRVLRRNRDFDAFDAIPRELAPVPADPGLEGADPAPAVPVLPLNPAAPNPFAD